MDNLKEILDKTYEPGAFVPWDTQEPPVELVTLLENGTIKPGKALDIGCGHGYFSIYLAKKGFEVTAIDISGNAIAQAKENAKQEGVAIHFQALDARNVKELKDYFNFVLEWGLLHFIFPEFREAYVRDIASRINKDGLYMMITFNDQSSEWGGGKIRVGFTGAPLYYSSLEELVTLYEPYFEIVEKKTITVKFKNSGKEHLENYLLLKKR